MRRVCLKCVIVIMIYKTGRKLFLKARVYFISWRRRRRCLGLSTSFIKGGGGAAHAARERWNFIIMIHVVCASHSPLFLASDTRRISAITARKQAKAREERESYNHWGRGPTLSTVDNATRGFRICIWCAHASRARKMLVLYFAVSKNFLVLDVKKF